ncbi:MAG: TIGR02996 domain-containing protein [Gemmataceae bacterium]
MASTRDELVRQIRQNPGNLALVLIYADWLEENGRALEAKAVRIRKRVGRSCGVSEIPNYFDEPPSSAGGAAKSWIGHHCGSEGCGSGEGNPKHVEVSGNGFHGPTDSRTSTGRHAGDLDESASGDGVSYGYHERNDGTGCGFFSWL